MQEVELGANRTVGNFESTNLPRVGNYLIEVGNYLI